MPIYLVSNQEEKFIILCSPEFLQRTPEESKPLNECWNADLVGLPVYHKTTCIAVWPKEDELLSRELIEAISKQIEKDKSEAMRDFIESVVFDASGKLHDNLDPKIGADRCPCEQISITKNVSDEENKSCRKLMITIIPSDAFLKNHEVQVEQEQFVTMYYNNSIDIYECYPEQTLAFSLIKFNNYKLAISESVDRFSSDEAFSSTYLDSWENIQDCLIAPYLKIISLLHDQDFTHGDITDSNVALSTQFKKLIFIDFKLVCHREDYINDLEWHRARLRDLYDVCGSIINYLPNEYNKTPLAFYLNQLRCELEDCEDDDQVVLLHEQLTIDRVTSLIDTFSTIPDDDDRIVFFENNDLSNDQIDQISSAYVNATRENNSALMSFYEEVYRKYLPEINFSLTRSFLFFNQDDGDNRLEPPSQKPRYG